MKEIFKRHPRYAQAPQDFEALPDNLWTRCPQCKELLYSKEHEQALYVCSKCKYHSPVSARERLAMTLDEGSFVECDAGIRSTDPIHFRSSGESYSDKLTKYTEQADANEAFIYGTGRIEGQDVVMGVIEFKFCGGTVGAATGEKLARAVDLAVERRLPLVLVSGGGGMRMQEGIISLMQMAKTLAALDRLRERGLPYISIMVDPCLGGTTASYAMMGDVNIAEPGAYIGFAGRRVIEQTMRQKLPQDAATAEFLLQHGMVDMVTQRAEIPGMLARLLKIYMAANVAREQDLVGQPA
jgi:acetyl-CoA carboxylase carboxyl transferase subunit beta